MTIAITITTCGECPFCDFDVDSEDSFCYHPDNKYTLVDPDNDTIHPSCPESGPFTLETKPKNTEDEKQRL